MLHILLSILVTVGALALAALFTWIAYKIFGYMLSLIAPTLVILILAPGIAHAGFGPVAIGSTIQWLLDNLVIPVLALLAIWGVKIVVGKVAQLLHVKITAQEQAAIDAFADRAVSAGLHKAQGAADEYLSAHPITVDTKNAIANEALSWGLANLPAMLERRGITAEKLAPEIEAAMGRLLASQPKPTPPVGPPLDIRPSVDKAPVTPAAS